MSGDAATLIGLWAIAYLIGALPVSYLLGRALGGIDLRQHGSGNVGASNFASQMGKKWWLPIAAIDMGRGAGPIVVGHYALGLSAMPWWLMLTPLFTILGNNWSPFLRFTGGRSVGAWAGGILGMSPLFFVAGLALYVLGWRVTRRSAEWLLIVMIALPAMAMAWPERWLLVGGNEQLAVFAAAGSGPDTGETPGIQRTAGARGHVAEYGTAQPAAARPGYCRPGGVARAQRRVSERCEVTRVWRNSTPILRR